MVQRKSGETYELNDQYKDDEEEAVGLRPSLEDAYRSDSSDEEDIDEHDPLNLDAGTLKRKKQRRSRSNIENGATTPSKLPRKRRWFVPTKFCCWMFVLFFVTVALLLSAGGIWAVKTAPEDGQSPAWYPSPLGGTVKHWEESYKKAAKMVSQMTLIEKVNVTTGTGWMMNMCVGNTAPVERLGFPSLCLQDGPLGIRYTENITAFPAAITTGATWNKQLMFLRGQLHGREAWIKGVNVILGPSMGPIGRSPLGGRNWEGYGSDPVLQAVGASENIRGIQGEGVIATAKHFVANEQEHFRQAWEWGRPNAISSNVDDRTLHEIYAWPFAASVKVGVGSIMCSYNQVNNSYACQNSKLMNGILKDELGFQGFIQSDWLAQRSGVASALAGLDVTMPGDGLRWEDGRSLWGGELTKAVLNGSVPIERLNDMVTRVVATWYQLGQDDMTKWKTRGPNFSSWTDERVGLLHPASDDKSTGVVNDFVNAQGEGGLAHKSLARKIAAEGTVVVKNEGNILPLIRSGWRQDSKDMPEETYRVAVIGEDARRNQNGDNACKDRGCNTGTLASGWGSGSVDFPYLVTPWEALEQAWFDNVAVGSYGGTNWSNGLAKLVKESHMCMVFTNSDGGEGYIQAEGIAGDRNDLWPQKYGNRLIDQVHKNCGNGTGDVIVVIHSIGPVIVEQFVDLPRVKAIVFANLPGQESGNALVDVLFGDIDASGRLPYTVGKKEEDYGPGAKIVATSKAIIPQADFSEGLFIDYRHFDYYNITPRYEFGFGLSYTKWHLSSGQIAYKNMQDKFVPLPNPRPAGVKPPTYDTTLPDAKTALFPEGFRKLKKYIYPYIMSVDGIKHGPPQYPPNFAESNPSPLSEAGGEQGGNPDLYTVLAEVRATLTNTGDRSGSCVVQLYVGLPQDYEDEVTDEIIKSPVRVLRAFEKIPIKKTKSGRQEVKFELTRKDLSYWSTTRQNWVLPTKKDITIEVGFSSRDLPIKMTY